MKIKFFYTIMASVLLLIGFQNCGSAGGEKVEDSTSTNAESGLDQVDGESTLSQDENTDQYFSLPVGSPPASTASCNIAELDMRWPLSGERGEGWEIGRYFDMTDGPGVSDYSGGARTSEGFPGIRIDTSFMTFNGNGLLAYAADAGRVVGLKMDAEDRIVSSVNECTPENSESNYLIIEHANGYKTVYYKIRKGTSSLQVGDMVAKGAALGEISSNGCSFRPGLQFEVRNCENEPVPIMANREALFNTPVPAYDVPRLQIAHSAFNGLGSISFREFQLIAQEPETVKAGPEIFGQHIHIYNVEAGDFMRCTIKDPTDRVVRTTVIEPTQDYFSSFWRCHFDMNQLSGNYTFEWKINSQVIIKRPMTVVR